ncbi:hypothetical protein HanPI659440_Chr06g0223411 [Helianthus annuus]|uniref:Uncharacterized protein n=1 Tax=Helianthus annuus TaxID=4232 RepID=A0A251UFG6_HELAN|nr:hypothetical protein HanXRQr2_Chr06g0243371 [Helianthus annuus]KAJ0565334.1 hypothetical protein HanIR_Chr06g0261481 [Helianthus annuus]KAJ0572329.1 hypothetical protein HanHA89_Chr06g0214551 [Helianthus annuus]KAJ0736780.1 hypothetical protein HanLR1_Chr06g0199691 [Helianthus annuus]KAJ0779151.1 hypothetical protein HanPI659440_Chr06g0223411 [Helianthus annuus]
MDDYSIIHPIYTRSDSSFINETHDISATIMPTISGCHHLFQHSKPPSCNQLRSTTLTPSAQPSQLLPSAIGPSTRDSADMNHHCRSP